MSRALWVWKLKLCLAATAAILAFAMAPQQRPQHEQEAKDKKANLQMVVDRHDAKAPVPAQARQPAQHTDSRDRLSALL
jgi:hypothetical protein